MPIDNIHITANVYMKMLAELRGNVPEDHVKSAKALFLSYFFVKKYLLVGALGMLWAGGSVDQ